MIATASAVAFVVYSCKGKLGEADALDLKEAPVQIVDDMFIVQTKNGYIQMRAEAPIMERYERDWLFSDDEADATLCSYKQTTFMANMIGSIMTNLFVNFCANDLEGDEKPMIDRSLPFLTSYDASLMMFTTEA